MDIIPVSGWEQAASTSGPTQSLRKVTFLKKKNINKIMWDLKKINFAQTATGCTGIYTL